MSLASLARQRVELLAELASVDASLRVEACEAVTAGRSVSEVARAAGVTRPTMYAWLRSSDRGEARLAELEARYERLVDLLVEVLKPAPQVSRKGNLRSGLQAEHSADTYLRGGVDRRTPTQRLRSQAELLLVSVGGDAVDVELIRECAEQAGFNAKPGEDLVAAVIREVDEAYSLRKRLELASDPFADV